MGPLIGKPGKPGYFSFSPVFLVELDVEKALDEQLFFEAFRTRRVRPHRQHQRLADSRCCQGTVALGIVILAQISNSPWTGDKKWQSLHFVDGIVCECCVYVHTLLFALSISPVFMRVRAL
jgi:hypothetical protein